MTLSPELIARIEAYAERLADEAPPLNEAQIAVLKRIFLPRILAKQEVGAANSAETVRTTVQLRDPASYARPLLDRLETRRRAGFVGPTLTDHHVERFVKALISPQYVS